MSANSQNQLAKVTARADALTEVVPVWSESLDPNSFLELAKITKNIRPNDPLVHFLKVVGFYHQALQCVPEQMRNILDELKQLSATDQSSTADKEKLLQDLVRSLNEQNDKFRHFEKFTRIWHFLAGCLFCTILLAIVMLFNRTDWGIFGKPHSSPAQEIAQGLNDAGVATSIVNGESSLTFIFDTENSPDYQWNQFQTGKRKKFLKLILPKVVLHDD